MSDANTTGELSDKATGYCDDCIAEGGPPKLKTIRPMQCSAGEFFGYCPKHFKMMLTDNDPDPDWE